MIYGRKTHFITQKALPLVDFFKGLRVKVNNDTNSPLCSTKLPSESHSIALNEIILDPRIQPLYEISDSQKNILPYVQLHFDHHPRIAFFRYSSPKFQPPIDTSDPSLDDCI